MRTLHAAVIEFVGSYIETNGFSPTYDEISAGIGINSKGRVSLLVSELVELGKVRRVPNAKRTIEIVKPGDPPPAPIPPKVERPRALDFAPLLGAARHVVRQAGDGCLSMADIRRLEAAVRALEAA